MITNELFVYVYMYGCMYHMYECMYICMNVCIICMNVCIYMQSLYARIYALMYACIYADSNFILHKMNASVIILDLTKVCDLYFILDAIVWLMKQTYIM